MYDMQYDIQLKAAVDILLKEDVPALLRTTKTVHELQDAAKAALAVSEAAGKKGDAAKPTDATKTTDSPQVPKPADLVPQP